MSKLTVKQEAFAKAYIETGNASEAYRRAYNAKNFSENALAVQASKTLKHPKVALRIAELQASHQKRHEITVDRIVQEYAKLAFSNMLDYVTVDHNGGAFVDLSKLTRDQAAAIQEVTVEHLPARSVEGEGESKVPVLKTRIKISDKKTALDSLGKHLGMFKDLHEHTGKDGEPIEVVGSEHDAARRIAFMLGKAVGRVEARTENASVGS
jgi:phage terminase small subunit